MTDEDKKQSSVSQEKLDKDVNQLDKDVKQFLPKIWSLETITFMLFIFGFLSFILSFWEQVSLVPRINKHYSDMQTFETSRMQLLDRFRIKWTSMREGYGYFILDCMNGKIDSAKMEAYTKQNEELLNGVRETIAGVLDYYYGKSIHSIIISELQWYDQYRKQCPIQPGMSGIELNKILNSRQNMIVKLLLQKGYNPRIDSKYFDDPYYTNF